MMFANKLPKKQKDEIIKIFQSKKPNEAYMQFWFKYYNQWAYDSESIWEDSKDKFKKLFKDAGFILKDAPNLSYKASKITHAKLPRKEHVWIFYEAGYCMITNDIITLYRLDAVEEYIAHVKDLLNEIT